MKILKQERKANKVEIDVELPAKLLKQEIGKVYDEIVRDAKLPGFRKGKAPKKLIETRIKKEEILGQAIQNLISDSYPGIIKEAGIEPVDFPQVNVKSASEGKPLVFNISVDVYPEVKLRKYKGIVVEAEDSKVSEQEVDNFINDLRERFAHYHDVGARGLKDGDVALLDLAATSEGGDIKSLSGKDINLVIGKGYISGDFDNNLLGLKIGESKDFKVVIPKESRVKEVAGKEVKFKAQVKGIKERELPPLDSEFSRRMSGKETVEEFKQEVKSRLEKVKSERIDSEVRDRLVQEVSSELKADIPPGMVRREEDLMIDELKMSLSRDKLTLDDYLRSTRKDLEGLRAEMKNGAEARVKGKIALRAVAEAEKIGVIEGDIEKELRELARSSGSSVKDFKKKIGEGGIESVRDYLLRRKALDFLVSKAKIKKKKK